MESIINEAIGKINKGDSAFLCIDLIDMEDIKSTKIIVKIVGTPYMGFNHILDQRSFYFLIFNGFSHIQKFAILNQAISDMVYQCYISNDNIIYNIAKLSTTAIMGIDSCMNRRKSNKIIFSKPLTDGDHPEVIPEEIDSEPTTLTEFVSVTIPIKELYNDRFSLLFYTGYNWLKGSKEINIMAKVIDNQGIIDFTPGKSMCSYEDLKGLETEEKIQLVIESAFDMAGISNVNEKTMKSYVKEAVIQLKAKFN